jgi:hypothetical protein
VQVLLGRADGTLAPARAFTSSAKGNADDIEIADLNSDGNGDLVMPVNGGNQGGWIGPGTTVSVLLSNGDGTFEAPREFPAGLGPTRAAVADFNGDGKRDVVVTNWLNRLDEVDTVSVLLGNGDGTLAAPLATPLFANSGPFNMVAADLNGDGRQDVAVAHSTCGTFTANGEASVLFGNGDGSFQKIPRFRMHCLGTEGHLLATADFNRDGLGDLVVTGLKVSIQKREPYQFSDDGDDPQNPEGTQGSFLGNGLFGLPELYPTPSTGRVTAADFDRDGWTDVAAIGEEGDARTRVLTVLLNRTASLAPVSLASLTLDADTVLGGTTSGGTVTLSAPAPPGGAIVELATTRPFLIEGVPSVVTIAEGQTSARFTFEAAALHPDYSPAQTTATIIAQLRDVTKTAPITVLTPGGKPPDFTLEASPASLTIVRGGASASTAVTILPRSGFKDQVTLTLSGVPAGVNVTPARPVTVSPDDPGTYPSTSFTFAATSTAKAGTFTVTITGASSGGLSRSTTIKLQVKRN